MTHRLLTFVLLALSVPLGAVHRQTNDESAAIRATALDYVEGWYTGDAPRMERALHPELAKRIVNTNPQNGRSSLGQRARDDVRVGRLHAHGEVERPLGHRQCTVGDEAAGPVNCQVASGLAGRFSA